MAPFTHFSLLLRHHLDEFHQLVFDLGTIFLRFLYVRRRLVLPGSSRPFFLSLHFDTCRPSTCVPFSGSRPFLQERHHLPVQAADPCGLVRDGFLGQHRTGPGEQRITIKTASRHEHEHDIDRNAAIECNPVSSRVSDSFPDQAARQFFPQPRNFPGPDLPDRSAYPVLDVPVADSEKSSKGIRECFQRRPACSFSTPATSSRYSIAAS